MADKSGDSKRTKRERSFGKIGGAAIIGSAMAGLEGAVFRHAPPPIEVVNEHRHRGPVVSGDGKLVITLPEDVAQEPADY
jgi:hypothetical protein